MSPEPFVSRAKAAPAKRSEKGYGDENGCYSATTRTAVTASKRWNHLSLKQCSSQSVKTLKNAVYEHFKLSQYRAKIFNPFLDRLS